MMLEELLVRYRKSGILLDTNLFLLYLIGSYDPEFVPQFKRTQMYTTDEFNWLHEYSKKFAHIIITPQILAESWNLLEKLEGKRFDDFLSKALPVITISKEEYVHKDVISQSNGFHHIGFTDMSVIIAAKKLGCLVITDDLRAYHCYYSNEVPVLNINHLRKI